MSRQQLCKFRIERNIGRLCGIHKRQFVEHIGEPLRFGAPRGIQSPDSIFNRFTAGIHFFGERHLGEVHDGSTQAEVFAKDIFEMSTRQRFALHAEHGLIFEFHIDIGVRLQNGLIENSHRSHGVIHRVIHIFGKCRTTGRDHY